MAGKGPFIQRFVRRVFYKYYARNLMFELQMRARADSADYAEAHMAEAIMFESSEAFLRHCLSRAPAGAILEFGVADGRTVTILGEAAPGRPVHGFDSFEGLPEDWAGHNLLRGAFSRKGELPKVPANVTLHKGWFKDTIGVWKEGHSDMAGFIHVDCDIYSSARDVLFGLRDRMQAGTIIVFDEYFNYPNWRLHEARALKEFVAEFGVKYRYCALTANEGAVAIELLSV